MKIRRNRPTSFFGGPHTDHFGPLFAGKKCQPCIRGDLKWLKNDQNRVFGHLMQSIDSPSPVLRSRIQFFRSLIPLQWFHDIKKTTTQKSLFFRRRKKHAFLGTRGFSKSTAYMDFYSQKKGECQIPNYRANCDVGVGFGMWGENTSK